jgi:membrane-associated phospholipid phosphatase
MKPPLAKRILLVMGAVLIQSIYMPTSLFMTGGVEPKLPIDIFPLWTVWVIPYVLCYPLWFCAFVWMTLKTDEPRFYWSVASLYFTFIMGISIFILFPTYVVLPELAGTDIFSRLLSSLQIAGGAYDALPSAHIYITVVLALIYYNWYPQYKWTWFMIVAIVSLSTLFTKQHYIADVLGGYLVGWLGFRVGLWWVTKRGGYEEREIPYA